ncbi:hypothetical protein M378DRAFT_160608 [Amanita muscaria Koide BX008]|uniref:Uncharacterized protein n=1 Tax=Amanita muscaria (strain Koide BX008) TaxID=946122 RepID=A0A0C2XB90_AMAMK|nr:hypothetical protein M378DRAFT_160608 [Amanita muscaria Koide BX008]
MGERASFQISAPGAGFAIPSSSTGPIRGSTTDVLDCLYSAGRPEHHEDKRLRPPNGGYPIGQTFHQEHFVMNHLYPVIEEYFPAALPFDMNHNMTSIGNSSCIG